MAATKELLYVHIIKKEEKLYHVVAISSNKTTWYSMPENQLDLNTHEQLKTNKIIKNSIGTISKIGGFRKLGITFDLKMKDEYLDTEGNFSSYDEFEEEEKTTKDKKEDTYLLKKIEELEKKLEKQSKIKVSEIKEKFLLDTFNGKQDEKSWLLNFEKECHRFDISSSERKIETLKQFLEGSAMEWYQTNLIKFRLSEWENWKESFLLKFKKLNWSSMRIAFNFKYTHGSIIEYVIKKEHLLLEADKNFTEIARIYQIIYGLPIPMQELLEREKIINTNILITELKKHRDVYRIGENFKNLEEKRDTRTIINRQKKKPSYICEKLGFTGRYHPVQECRNKNKHLNINQTNLMKEEND